MSRVTLAGFMKMELPTGDVRICDGGTLVYGAETYVSYDTVFGSVRPPDPFEEGLGDIAPSSRIILLPPEASASSALSRSDFQGARERLWIAEIDESTGLISGDPELMADMAIDVTRIRDGEVRQLEIDLTSRAERLFTRNRSNSLNGAFHKGIYSGELGLDNAAGVAGPFPWGTKGPPRGTGTVSPKTNPLYDFFGVERT